MFSSLLLYILSGFIIVWLFAFISYLINKKRQKKQLKNLRAAWGKPNNIGRNYNLIESFAALTTDKPFHQLTPQTIADIDLYEVFTFIDRTNSKPGQQYLFNQLIKPTNNIKLLKQYNEQINYFLENTAARENAQLLLLSLNHHDAYYITNLLDDTLLQKPKWAVLYIIDSLVVVAMLLLSIQFRVLLLWLMIPLAINIFLYFKNKNYTAKFNKSFPQLNNLINVCKLFIKKDLPFEKENIKKSIDNLRGFKRKFRLLNFGDTAKDEITQTLLFFLELIKAFFLIEIHSFFSCLTALKNKKQDINNLINYIGSIDAALSTASLRKGTTTYTTPIFSDIKKELLAKNIYHPLVENCIKNSILIKDKKDCQKAILNLKTLEAKEGIYKSLLEVWIQAAQCLGSEEMKNEKQKQLTALLNYGKELKK